MKRIITAVLFLAVLTAACGADDTSETTDTPEPTSPPSSGQGVMLMIEDEGGFAPIEFIINRPPAYVLLYDGTLIFQGPQDAIFPGPIMPTMQQLKLTADQMKDVMVLIEATGLPTIDDVSNNDAANFVADATSTIATYTDPEGATHRFSVYALGISQEAVSDEIANLALLRDTIAGYTFEGGAGQPYTSDRVIMRVLEGAGFGEVNDTRPWPFSFEPSGEPIQMQDVPCQVFEGAAADEVRTIVAGATLGTLWEHPNGTFSVYARDLLPGEAGCPAQ